MQSEELSAFVYESNKIEGINRPPSLDEFEAHETVLLCDDENELYAALVDMADGITGGVGKLRDQLGRDVMVGSYIAPKGGPNIPDKLRSLLAKACTGMEPLNIHKMYETLHPFMDGNGRTGRALWLWQMVELHQYDGSLGFLHAYYYQTLEGNK